ncbi:MAG: DUF2110 family protein [Candidatus Bathyarchaeia archaeon]
MKFTIAEKLAPRISPKALLNALSNELKEISSGIDASYRIVGFNEKNWIKVEITGEDVEVFRELIGIKFGFAKTNLNDLRIGDVCKGFVTNGKGVEDGILMDIGLVHPVRKDAFYPLLTARAQLAEGKGLSIKEVIDRYCLYEGFPLRLRVTSIDYGDGSTEVELLNTQEDYLKSILNSPLEKVLIFDAFKEQILKALKLTDIEREIASIEQLGLTVFILVCKLGTNSSGIISRIGSLLRGSRIYALKLE